MSAGLAFATSLVGAPFRLLLNTYYADSVNHMAQGNTQNLGWSVKQGLVLES